MATSYRSRKVVEAVRWDGSADTANAFIGECYGVDWEYAVGSSDIYVRGIGGLTELVEVSHYLVKQGRGVYGMSAEAFAEHWEPLFTVLKSV